MVNFKIVFCSLRKFNAIRSELQIYPSILIYNTHLSPTKPPGYNYFKVQNAHVFFSPYIRLFNSRNPYNHPISILTHTRPTVVPKRFKQYKQNKYVRALFNADFRQYTFELREFESVCNKRKLNLIDQQRDQKKIWHSKSMRRIYAYPPTATAAAAGSSNSSMCSFGPFSCFVAFILFEVYIFFFLLFSFCSDFYYFIWSTR